MRILATVFGVIFVTAFMFGCSSAPEEDPGKVETPAEEQPRILAEQYEAAAARQKQPGTLDEDKPAFDLSLDAQQREALEAVLTRVKARLASQLKNGPPELTHISMRTGAPDHLLLSNIWFVAQLPDDNVPWRYELTLLWKDVDWVAFGGTAQHGAEDGRELEPAFVADLTAPATP